MNKIVNGVANDYEFPQLDWVHHDSTTIKIPSDEETTNLAKAICDYFPSLVEENKKLKQELQRKDNIINELEKWLNEMLKHNKECLEEERGTGHQTLDIIAFNRSAYIKIWENVLDKIKELESK